MTAFFALTTRGLEAVAAAEIAALAGVTVNTTAYRRVLASAEVLAPLLTLRTVDDVYLELAQWADIGHTRDMLAVLRESAAMLDSEAAVEHLRGLRDISGVPSFSVTASFVGKRNFTADDIKQAVAEGIGAAHDWPYTADDRTAALNVRVFIDHATALVGVRLGAAPLHERGGRSVERAGALKAPVAAAMLRLVGTVPGQTVLDPCCGSGTLLLEAAAIGAAASGGDLDIHAVQAARTNMRAAGQHLRIDQWDARRLPLGDDSCDVVVSNLPWGRQVAVDEALADLYGEICLEIERVLRPGGHAALLTTAPELLRFSVVHPTERHDISLFGQTPTICLFEK